MTATITPMEALLRLIEACKLIDFADCKDETVWQTLVGAQGVAEGVVRDYVEPKPVGHVNHYSSGSVGVSGQSMLALPHGAPLYAAAAQPSKNALADEVIAALDALQVGCTEQSWIGWQNGNGEEVGTRLQTAIDAYKAAPTAAVSAVADSWRVAEFWSSANPGSKVLMLAQGSDIDAWGKRGDFIRWVSPVAAVSAAPSGEVWQPIETAPCGANGISFMMLAWGPEGDQSTGTGIRIDDDFYAAGVFYCMGKKEKPFELREAKVKPTHWMANPEAPAITATKE